MQIELWEKQQWFNKIDERFTEFEKTYDIKISAVSSVFHANGDTLRIITKRLSDDGIYFAHEYSTDFVTKEINHTQFQVSSNSLVPTYPTFIISANLDHGQKLIDNLAAIPSINFSHEKNKI